MKPFLKKMAEGTISYLEKVKKDCEERGWHDEVKKINKQIAYVKKHGIMPAER